MCEMPRSPKASGVDPSKESMSKEEAPEIDDDESDEDEILEVSDNGRWQKFNEQVWRMKYFNTDISYI